METIRFECQTCFQTTELPCVSKLFDPTRPLASWVSERLITQSGHAGFVFTAEVFYCSAACADGARAEAGVAAERLAAFRRGLLRLHQELLGASVARKPSARLPELRIVKDNS